MAATDPSTRPDPHRSTLPHTGPEFAVTPPPPDPFAATVEQTAEMRALSADRSTGLPTVPGYELLGEIGRGGMGVVYKARQVKADRVVALKMILAGGHAGAAEYERFRVEVEASARLKHPGIVQVYEVGEHAGLPFFSMEFCDRGSLACLAGGKPMAPRAAAAVVERLARAVEAAHVAGIVHRDLKPANILIADDGTPKVGDFGMAKRMGSDHGQTKSGAVMGTPAYMAPEQAAGKAKRVGPAADVYALGAILFELLTGHPPFRAESLPELLQKVAHDAPPAVSDLRDGVPRDLETICEKCLAKEPARRYPTAGAVAEDLRRFQAGESITARDLGVVGRVAWMLGRNQYDVQFAKYAGFFFCLAPVILLTEAAVTAVRWTGGSDGWVVAAYLTRIAVGVGLFLYFGRGRVWPTNPAEQHMLSVWSGFILAAVLLSVNLPLDGAVKYQALAAGAGVAFVSLAAMFWGGCYLIGVAFFLLIPMMGLDPRLAPLEFGLVWAAVCTLVGVRLRRLGREQGA